MKLTSLALLAALAAAPVSAQVLIDFEGPTSFESVDDYYDGGTDGAGVVGPDLGVVFGGDVLALRNAPPEDVFFSNAPSPIGVMTPVGAASTMNVDVGFSGVFSLYYSSTAATSGVQLWSGLNGTGSLLANLGFLANAQTGCSDTSYCNFDLLSTTFTGIARSATFTGATNVAAIDNISITPVPEPAAMLAMSLGMVGLAAARRRRR